MFFRCPGCLRVWKIAMAFAGLWFMADCTGKMDQHRPCNIQSIQTIVNNTILIQNDYQYSATGRLEAVGETTAGVTVTRHYYYDVKGRPSFSLTDDKDSVQYFYNSQGQLSEDRSLKGVRNDYVYNDQGQLILSHLYHLNPKTGNYELQLYYTYDRNYPDSPDFTTLNNYDPTGKLSYSITYSYDNFPNPWYAANLGHPKTSLHNIRTLTIVYPDNSSPVTSTYTYKYSTMGYPLSKTYNFTGGLSEEYYTYSNCR